MDKESEQSIINHKTYAKQAIKFILTKGVDTNHSLELVWIVVGYVLAIYLRVFWCFFEFFLEILVQVTNQSFFLHIPFPSFDIIRIFPWVDEILMGMLGTYVGDENM